MIFIRFIHPCKVRISLHVSLGNMVVFFGWNKPVFIVNAQNTEKLIVAEPKQARHLQRLVMEEGDRRKH